MRRRVLARASLSIAALILAVLACDLPNLSPSDGEVDPAATMTKRALETEVAFAKETAQPGEAAGSPTTNYEEYAVMVSVSVDSACRSGPGEAYESLGELLVDDTAEVIARSEDGMFFYIQFPHAPPKECWIWAQYAHVDGELRELAVFTPPPIPESSITPTVEPGLVVEGHVRLADGSGVTGVTICRSYASYEGEPVAATDAEGYFQTDFSYIPGDEMVTVWAIYEGYVFEPENYFWRHYFGYELTTRDFVAVPSKAGDSTMPDCR
jgi:hypothetical protein